MLYMYIYIKNSIHVDLLFIIISNVNYFEKFTYSMVRSTLKKEVSVFIIITINESVTSNDATVYNPYLLSVLPGQ